MVVGILSGCNTNQTFVRLSEISVAKVKSKKVTDLYLSNNEFGLTIHQVWMTGIYGNEIKVHLTDSSNFESMLKKH
jgi:hypothetical protein